MTAAFVYPINTIMNILELDSYDLGDAVKFNARLNPKIWAADETMLPKVRDHLMEIAQDFREFLGITDLQLKDITVSGSNAAYTYTPHSDIDLHLVVDLPEADASEVYRELFDAKKYQYNEQHNIKIGGYDVELYVQDANKPHHSQGIYSVANNEWIDVPKRRRPAVDDISTQSKYEDLSRRIDSAIASDDYATMTAMTSKIRDMRQAGLDAHGEFGPENLAFKMLRTQGKIKQLHDARNAAKDRELSLKERRQPHSVFTYGFKHEEVEPVVEQTVEVPAPSDEEILKDFIQFCVAELKIKSMPTVKLRRDPQWSVVNRTFGRYINDTHLLEVAFGQRHIMDVLRTVAHELTHKHQHERETVPSDAGETGSPYENEANARAGILMRDYGRLHPELFDAGETELGESASGYIPTKKQAKDPRFSMALTQDIRPGQLGKEANKLNLKTNKQGVPQVANPNGLFEQLMMELTKFRGANDKDVENHTAPLGPETPPEFPAGTVKVDVSDVYDWYKLGQNMANLDHIDPDTLDQGPPQTILAFGSEPEEHKYMKQLKNLGLKVHDIDPSWYHDVDETVNAPVNKTKDAEQYYKFIVAKHKMGRPLTRQEQEYVRSYKMFNQQVAESVEVLDEVRMSPSNLMQWARSPEAQGIRAGFEAELIFRDTNNNGDSDYEMEPDYDADERCRSIQDIIDFFSGGDYGNLSPRQERALQEGLDEQYYEWYDEQMHKDFREEAEDLIRKVMVDEGDWDLDNEIQKQLELLDLTDDEMNEIIKAGEKAPKFTSSKEQILYAEQNPLYQKYLDAQEEAEGLLDDLIQDEVRKEGANWDAALDDFRDNYQIDDDSGFFDDVGLRWMSDVANNYDLDWPYMTGGGGNDGSRDWESIGDSLHDTIDMPVKVSSGYHHATRKEDLWIVEPDTSLEPDDREDFGLEIVSPPMPLLTALEKLQDVCDWANDPTEGNAYTNDSTGLHMGVSVPFKGGDVDYLKLILFLGDEYVLKSFGREANTYCKSAMSKFKENLKGGRADPMGVIKLMQSGLLELAHREIQKGVGDGKYTSAHIQKGYIEFRSPGGDWLAEESADPEKLQSTMLRFARAMSLAANPSEERREYAKKLYKLVAPEGDSELALFSQFASGELTAEQLKKRWAEKTIGTEKKMNQRFRLYQNVDGVWEPVPGAEWNGYPEDEVKMRVWAKYGREALDSGEYQLVNMGEQDWEVYDVKTGKTLEIVKGKSKGEVADQVYDKYVDQGIGFQVRPWEDPAKMTPRAKLAKRITTKKPEPKQVANQATNERGVPYWEVYEIENEHVVHTFLSDTAADAKVDGANWLESIGAEYPDLFAVRPKIKTTQVKDVEPDVAQNFAPPNATDRVGSWAIYDVTLGREISRMNDVPWQQASDRADELERSTGHNMSVRGLSETVDPVSGRGAVAPATQPKLKPQPAVKPVDPAVRVDINKHKEDPLAQTYKKPVNETLPAKNLNQLYTIKRQLANPAFSTAEPEPAEKPVPARPAQPRVHTALADLQRQRDKVQQIMDLKQEIETLTARAGRTRYGITPGLSADIEDIYPNPATEADMDAAIQGYEVQKKKLTDYIARQRKVFPKEDVAENFADGKGPGRPGDSQRHGIPKGATMAELEKASHSAGRKGQLARWQLNMRRGKAKAK